MTRYRHRILLGAAVVLALATLTFAGTRGFFSEDEEEPRPKAKAELVSYSANVPPGGTVVLGSPRVMIVNQICTRYSLVNLAGTAVSTSGVCMEFHPGLEVHGEISCSNPYSNIPDFCIVNGRHQRGEAR
jgi:hypothetical protein